MYSSEEWNKSFMGLTAMKSVLGGATANIQRYGCISLLGVGVVGDMTCNTFLYQTTKSKSTTNSVQPLGQFHQFDQSLQEEIILMGMTDAPATQKRNNDDLDRQAKARRIK
jgi:hypothetical protein